MSMKVGYSWNGKKLSRAEFLRRRIEGSSGVPVVRQAITSGKPLESLAMSCHRSQVGEYNAFCCKHGITGAYYRSDGTCVLESRQARNQLMKARGLHDNDAGYGDYAGK